MMYAILVELLRNVSAWNHDAHIVEWITGEGLEKAEKRAAQQEPGTKWLTETENLKALKVADKLAQLLSELSVSCDGALGSLLPSRLQLVVCTKEDRRRGAMGHSRMNLNNKT